MGLTTFLISITNTGSRVGLRSTTFAVDPVNLFLESLIEADVLNLKLGG